MLRYSKIVVKSLRTPCLVTQRYIHNDPLGLKAILREAREEELQKTQKTSNSSLDEFLHQMSGTSDLNDTKAINNDLIDDIYIEDDSGGEGGVSKSGTKFSEVNDYEELSGFLDSLQTTGLEPPIDTSSTTNSRPPADMILREQELFRDAFDSLIKESEKTKTPKMYGNLIDYSQRRSDSSLTANEVAQLSESLQPSLDYISSIETEYELTESLNKMLSRTTKMIEKSQTNKSLREKLLVTASNFPYVLKMAQRSSDKTPTTPELNAFTLPVLFKQYLQTCNTKFKNGQLTLSYFNYLKSNFHLHLMVCDNSTYNEILKTIWIFQGKLNLYQIEATITEMEGHGFPGDLMTFNILKEIILDYYSLKLGDFKPANNNLPIWSTEDDERVNRLEDKLRRISRKVRRTYVK